MAWKNETTYQQVFRDGLILTEGYLAVETRDSQPISIPMFQLMKVNRRHPMLYTYGETGTSLRPKGDNRSIKEIQQDSNKELYDGISVLFCPPTYDFSRTTESFTINGGYRAVDSTRGDLTISYLDLRVLEMLGDKVAHMPAPSIPHFLVGFLSRKPAVMYRNSEEPQILGRIDLEKTVLIEVAMGVSKKLESRFDIRMFTST